MSQCTSGSSVLFTDNIQIEHLIVLSKGPSVQPQFKKKTWAAV